MTELDDLFREAKRAYAAQHAPKAKKPKRDPDNREDAPAIPQEKYTNPANWTRTRGVALIHEETETLLGNFGEFVHRTEPGCRKLVRENRVILVTATERVAGSWWVAANAQPQPRQIYHTQHTVTLHADLDKLGLHCPACELVIHVSHGGIARAELAADTVFAQKNAAYTQLLFFPAGTNILPEMSRDCKVGLRVALGAAK